ncbi:hypothetical protein [Effusibacillus consociatus]|uniref:Uncharacterized protein n=1 Tax=Effusibacillus consociatus TaxID=1117041 RepID=A0ABV9Q085_9BACL
MPNLWEAAINTLKSMIDDEPKAPLHIGEALTCWMHLAAMAEAVVFEEAGLNMTTDAEVMRMLEDAIKLCNSQIKQLKIS